MVLARSVAFYHSLFSIKGMFMLYMFVTCHEYTMEDVF